MTRTTSIASIVFLAVVALFASSTLVRSAHALVGDPVTVTIVKYIDGTHATTTTATSSFPMSATWNSTSTGSGSGTFALGPVGFNNPNPYEATTADMTTGASYSTSEDTSGPTVGADCTSGKPFRLVGYSTGDSLAQAATSTVSSTSPALTNITSNKYVIVWNQTCAATSTLKVHILKYLDGVKATASSTSGFQFPMTATWKASNLNGGATTTGSFVLGNNHGGAPDQYGADTSPMNAPANYSTSEVTATSSGMVLPIGSACEAGKYRLLGYKTSALSFADAAAQTISTSSPSFWSLNSDRYVIVLNEKCVSTPPPPMGCAATSTQIFVSNAGDPVVGGGSAVAVATSSAWTASIPGATWIWQASSTAPNQTVGFEQTFTATGTVLSVQLTVASDNNYKVFLDGVQVAADANLNNFSAGNEDTHDFTASTTPGTHTLRIEVTNVGTFNATTNPAGLLYKLTVVNCPPITPPPPPPTGCAATSTQTFVSNAGDPVVGGGSAVAVATSSAWTASIPGATWIWQASSTAPNQTVGFEQVFTATGTVLSVQLTVASDNNYKVFLDGVQVAADANLNNFSSGNEDTYDFTASTTPGTHTLRIDVTNSGTFNATTNPAGLLYKLTVVNCPPITPPPPPPTGCSATTTPAGFTRVDGTSGNDTVTIAPNTFYVGHGGNDKVTGPNGNYVICTGAGNDTIKLGNGTATIEAGGGNNKITHGDGAATIVTGSGNDTIKTGNGNKNISTAGGNDTITTGSGTDTINAGGGNNKVKSGAGNDTVIAGSGNDKIDGQAGASDTCSADGGNNIVTNCEL